MPELPEVHTTVAGINLVAKGKKITEVWSAYNSPFHAGKNNIKNVHYFKNFRKAIVGAKILKAERRGKNILIDLSNDHTVLIHMKMTGHLLYGKYIFKKDTWFATASGPLQDPYNQFIRLVFSLSDGKHLAFSDVRKFAKVFIFPTKEKTLVPDLAELGPEPLDKNFDYKNFVERLKTKPGGKIKQVLMAQETIAGIGNIYSDEMLWSSGIHPLSIVESIPENKLKSLFKEMEDVLKRGIHFGGDSESDYRNIHGEPGEFQNKHHVYRHTGETCSRRNCDGIISKIKVGGRSAHFCPKHQELFK